MDNHVKPSMTYSMTTLLYKYISEQKYSYGQHSSMAIEPVFYMENKLTMSLDWQVLTQASAIYRQNNHNCSVKISVQRIGVGTPD